MDSVAVEEWRPVVGFEGAYEVSSLGRVRSLDRTVWNGRSMRKAKGRLLSPGRLPTGYLFVNLYRENYGTARRVHALVAEAFIGPRPGGMDVCHNDSNPSNNRADNLRFDTRAGNMADAAAAGHIGGRFNRKDHCKYGHPLSGETVAERQCKPCQRRRERESYERRKARAKNA